MHGAESRRGQENMLGSGKPLTSTLICQRGRRWWAVCCGTKGSTRLRLAGLFLSLQAGFAVHICQLWSTGGGQRAAVQRCPSVCGGGRGDGVREPRAHEGASKVDRFVPQTKRANSRIVRQACSKAFGVRPAPHKLRGRGRRWSHWLGIGAMSPAGC